MDIIKNQYTSVKHYRQGNKLFCTADGIYFIGVAIVYAVNN